MTVQELWETHETRERSLDALRARGRQGILACIGREGPTYIYDRQLSIIRLKAARRYNSWGRASLGRIGRIMRELDEDLNKQIIKLLNDETSESLVVNTVIQRLEQRLG